eukprot:jgi/Ulvmu1/2487/UM137_0013.1
MSACVECKTSPGEWAGASADSFALQAIPCSRRSLENFSSSTGVCTAVSTPVSTPTSPMSTLWPTQWPVSASVHVPWAACPRRNSTPLWGSAGWAAFIGYLVSCYAHAAWAGLCGLLQRRLV